MNQGSAGKGFMREQAFDGWLWSAIHLLLKDKFHMIVKVRNEIWISVQVKCGLELNMEFSVPSKPNFLISGPERWMIWP